MVRHSDIFDSYAKIAEEKGLVSLADEETSSQPQAPKESSKLKKYKKSPYPRAGSDDISTIEALYGVKPESTNKYEFNIMEAAHPKPVVIAPAYDRLNALVENNIERQNIIINITQKPNDGNLNYTKMARKELLMELVRLATDLDNSGRDDLRKIADDCIDGLKKKAFDVGEAWKGVKDFFGDEVENVANLAKGVGGGASIGMFAGALIGTIIEPGAGTLAGAKIGGSLGAESGFLAAFFGKTPPIVQSVAQNAKETSSKIDALKQHIPAGNQEAQFLDGFQQGLDTLADTSTKYNQTLTTVQSNPNAVKSEDHAISISKELGTNLDTQIKNVSDLAAQFNTKAQANVYKQWVSPSKLEQYTIYRFVDDAVDDVRHSIKALMDAIKQFDSVILGLHADMKGSSSAKSDTLQKNQPEGKEDQEYAEEPAGTGEEDEDYSDIVQTIGHEPSEKEMQFFKSLK